MSFEFDYIIVGAGLSGSTISRQLRDDGKDVLVVERRGRIGGNIADSVAPQGIRYHLYGPHLFRTSSEEVWGFVNRFANFYDYEHIVKSRVESDLENWPVAGSYIRKVCGQDWQPELTTNPRNFAEAALNMMPREIYERFVKGYTKKQWGRSAIELSADLCGRFTVHEDDDPRLTPDADYQGLPSEGYTALVRNMLQGIPVLLNCDYLEHKNKFKAREAVIYTGSLDEYFGFDMGRLDYRAQRRKLDYFPETEWRLPCAQVNNPGKGECIREIEWKHLMQADYAKKISGTLITREIPFTPHDPDRYEYPFPEAGNRELYQKYRERSKKTDGLVVCGRLGHYQYYDMDVAIEKAFQVADTLM